MAATRYLTAAEAAETLGISLPTLYAYVSRGLIRSESAGSRRRGRRYRRDDVERLRARQEQRRHPDKAAAQALSWGVPVLESSLSLIADGRLYYRGQEAAVLAASRTFEDVAQWLWTGAAGAGASVMPAGRGALRACAPVLKLLPEATPVERMQAILPLAAPGDPAAYDLRPAAVAQAGGRLLGLLAAAAVYPAAPKAATVAAALQQGWRPDLAGPAAERATQLINAALILSADHELNTSAFTARCVASVRATPYQVVIAALAALTGQRHGGHQARVEAFLDEVGSKDRVKAGLGGWLKRGEGLPGFGHFLYPEGDPRAQALLAMLQASLPRSRELALARAIAAEARSLVGEFPNIDFALVTVSRALRLPSGAGMALFALGRTAGWIAHAIEQYQSEAMIRPRARYVGLMPA